MNRPHPPAPSPKRGEGGQDLAFKVPLPLWERDLGRGNDIRARGLMKNGELLGAHGNTPDDQSENLPTYRDFKIWISYKKAQSFTPSIFNQHPL